MYLHCCHLLCSWCYCCCCGSLLIFIRYKCTHTDTPHTHYQPPISAIRCWPINRQPTLSLATFVVHYVCPCNMCVAYFLFIHFLHNWPYFFFILKTVQILCRKWQFCAGSKKEKERKKISKPIVLFIRLVAKSIRAEQSWACLPGRLVDVAPTSAPTHP